MAGEVRVIWHGEEVKKRILTQVEKGMVKCGLRIEREAKQMCPVDTGRLRSSLSTNWTNSKFTYGNVEGKAGITDGVSQPEGDKFAVKIGTRVDYASFQEHGTSRMSAHPFLFPAYEMNIRKLPQFIKGETPERSELG